MKKAFWIISWVFFFSFSAFEGLQAAECLKMSRPLLKKWLNEKVQHAKTGAQETIQIPIAYRGPYACLCPKTYVGDSPWAGAEEGFWVKPLFREGLKEPNPDPAKGLVIIADGYFTGRTLTEDLRGDFKEVTEWIYELKEFVVTGYKEFSGDCNTPMISIPRSQMKDS